ncbi:hypothetical protein LIA77_11339 [Sarocladium implicatum]|nr:hypothetical protein LIA77_11339 [Sarocladium implicatum]
MSPRRMHKVLLGSSHPFVDYESSSHTRASTFTGCGLLDPASGNPNTANSGTHMSWDKSSHGLRQARVVKFCHLQPCERISRWRCSLLQFPRGSRLGALAIRRPVKCPGLWLSNRRCAHGSPLMSQTRRLDGGVSRACVRFGLTLASRAFAHPSSNHLLTKCTNCHVTFVMWIVFCWTGQYLSWSINSLHLLERPQKRIC